jgi:hypothetical protein
MTLAAIFSYDFLIVITLHIRGKHINHPTNTKNQRYPTLRGPEGGFL